MVIISCSDVPVRCYGPRVFVCVFLFECVYMTRVFIITYDVCVIESVCVCVLHACDSLQR